MTTVFWLSLVGDGGGLSLTRGSDAAALGRVNSLGEDIGAGVPIIIVLELPDGRALTGAIDGDLTSTGATAPAAAGGEALNSAPLDPPEGRLVTLCMISLTDPLVTLQLSTVGQLRTRFSNRPCAKDRNICCIAFLWLYVKTKLVL